MVGTPVEYDPFAQQGAPPVSQGTPVDYNPFGSAVSQLPIHMQPKIGALEDIAETIPSKWVQGVDEMLKAPGAAATWAAKAGTQAQDLFTNFTGNTHYTPQERVQRQENVLDRLPISGPIIKALNNAPNISELESNLMQPFIAPNLTESDMQDLQKNGGIIANSPELHQPQTGIGKFVGNVAEALPSAVAMGVPPVRAAGAAVLGTAANAASPNNPLLQGVAMAVGARAPEAIKSAGEGIALRAKGFNADNADEIAAQSDKNWAQASQTIQSAHNQGAALTADAGQKILAYVKKNIGNLNSRHSDTQAELDDFEKAVNSGTLTLAELDKFRQNFGDVINDNTKSKIDGGGLNSDGQKAYMAKKAIMDSLDNLDQNDFSAGTPQAAAQLKQGINQWAKAARYDRIADLIRKSEGDSTAIKRNFTSFVNNEKNIKGFNDDEIAALQDAARRGTLENIERGLGTFGFDTGKLKNIVVPTLLKGSALAVPGGPALVGAGTALRYTGKLAARGGAQTALDTIMNRDTSVAPRAPAPPTPPAPPAAPMLALPAPRTIVNPQGQAYPESTVLDEKGFPDNRAAQPISTNNSEAGRWAQAQGNTPFTPQNAERAARGLQQPGPIEAADAGSRMRATQAFNQRDTAIEAEKTKNSRMNANWQSENIPPEQIVAESAQRLKDSGMKIGQVGDALMQMLKNQQGSISPAWAAAIGLAISAFMGSQQSNASQQAQQRLYPQPPAATGSIGDQNMQELQKLKATMPQSNAAPDISGFSKAESNNNPNAQSKTSSASGLLQFTNKTWAGMVQKYGQQTGITLSMKNNPQAQITMATLLAKDNIKQMQPVLGRMPTKGELYAGHVLGPSGAIKLIQSQGTGRESITLFPRQVFDANRNLFFNSKTKQSLTVEETYALLMSKVA